LSNDPPEDGVPMAASWALSASICFWSAASAQAPDALAAAS